MHGLQELRKINNKKLHDNHKFSVGSVVHIQYLDGKQIRCCKVERNDPKMNQLVAGGVEFDKSSGYSIGLDIPVKLVGSVTGTDSENYRRGKHIGPGQLSANMGHVASSHSQSATL